MKRQRRPRCRVVRVSYLTRGCLVAFPGFSLPFITICLIRSSVLIAIGISQIAT